MTNTDRTDSISNRGVKLRLSGRQHQLLRQHLFPGDDREAVALALCGRSTYEGCELLCVQHVEPIPYEHCSWREPDRVTWKTDVIPSLRSRAMKHNLGLLKIHSHPGGWSSFSQWDDAADRDLFPAVYVWSDADHPHLSAIMLPDGRIVARVVTPANDFAPVESVAVVGQQLQYWPSSMRSSFAGPQVLNASYQQRMTQAFGDGTTQAVSQLCVGVVGCSGTGSWVIELLARLGVRRFVLVDPDRVEPVNLNRILHATTEDAERHVLKVDVMRRALQALGWNVAVESHASDVREPSILRRLAHCDFMFGCVDSIEARDVLNRLAVYYTLPYIDVGVRLEADGSNGIRHVAGGVHYVHPDSPSLTDRGLYSAKDLTDAALRATDPSAFADQVARGYIRGANVARPAVASINAFYASFAVSDLLQRIHDYRDESPDGVIISLSQLRFVPINGGESTHGLSRRVGRGDVNPLLDLPFLSGHPGSGA